MMMMLVVGLRILMTVAVVIISSFLFTQNEVQLATENWESAS